MRREDSLLAQEAIALCRQLALFSETTPGITRTFLSAPMHACHDTLRRRMADLGMHSRVDAAGNLRGVLEGSDPQAGTLLIGSHIDTVPNAGAYDGILGVAIALALIQALEGEKLKSTIEILALSEEEGVRFGVPFIGSRALTGDLLPEDMAIQDGNGITVEQAIRDFGLNPLELDSARMPEKTAAFVEFHIEQGPVLDAAGESLAVVEAIAGQSRLDVTFLGAANHAGTTPMALRRDALAGAAEWIGAVEKEALPIEGLVATVGRLTVHPGATNVVPGEVQTSLDVRSAMDAVRSSEVERLLSRARQIGAERQLEIRIEEKLDQPAVQMNPELVSLARRASQAAGIEPRVMVSGAGHDSMILAQRVPTVMIFLRSPGGISHHPNESVRIEDVVASIRVGRELLRELDSYYTKARTI